MRLLALSVLLFSGNVFAQSIKSPNISANALFLYRNSNFANSADSTVRNGVDVQEAEVAFNSDVDPYSRLNILLSVHPVYTLNPTTNRVEQTWGVEPEEAFAEINHIPNTTVRIGKFKAALGKHNQLHTHAYPFVDAPLVNQRLLGDEGLNDVGVSAAYLLPTRWFSEFTFQYLRGEGENTEFSDKSPNDAVLLGHYKNLFDFSDDLTMESGLSYARGKNMMSAATYIGGADLTFKWRPTSGGKYHSWIFAGEYLNRSVKQPGAGYEIGSGWNVFGGYQFAERWLSLLRYDQLDINGSADVTVNPNSLTNNGGKRYSASLVFSATEFSAYRLEYNQQEGLPGGNGGRVERRVYVQANYTIGAHPAHSY